MNSSILMSGAEFFDNQQPINPYYDQSSIDVDKAIEELANIRHMLELAGVRVTHVAPPSHSQDGVYTANWALVRGKKAIMSRLPTARKAEELYAQDVLDDLGIEVIEVPEGLKFSGQGDALACGNYLFCGKGYRSDEEAQAFAADALGYERIQLQTIPQLDEHGQPVNNQSSGWPDSFYYDIDLALAIIKVPTATEKGLIAYCPEAFTSDSQAILEEFDGVEKIKVSEVEAKEGFACNLVSTGEMVVMSSNAPVLAAELRARGLQVFTPLIVELAKGGGYIRCTTLSLS
jgi:N-dimethylarginine dimethylaminohydrolase